MKNGTNIFIGERDLMDKGTLVQATIVKIDGTKENKWVVARPVGYIGFWHTVKCAWKVLRGQADIVIWKYQ